MEHLAETWVIESLAAALFTMAAITSVGWIATRYRNRQILLPVGVIAGGILRPKFYGLETPPGL